MSNPIFTPELRRILADNWHKVGSVGVQKIFRTLGVSMTIKQIGGAAGRYCTGAKDSADPVARPVSNANYVPRPSIKPVDRVRIVERGTHPARGFSMLGGKLHG
jgi:hypothetical protein